MKWLQALEALLLHKSLRSGCDELRRHHLLSPAERLPRASPAALHRPSQPEGRSKRGAARAGTLAPPAAQPGFLRLHPSLTGPSPFKTFSYAACRPRVGALPPLLACFSRLADDLRLWRGPRRTPSTRLPKLPVGTDRGCSWEESPRRAKKLQKVRLLLPDAGWKPLGRSLPRRFFPKRQNLLRKLPGASPLPDQPQGALFRRSPTEGPGDTARLPYGPTGQACPGQPHPPCLSLCRPHRDFLPSGFPGFLLPSSPFHSSSV
ncbi:protein piccolo-like [Pezoporus flaviventris]|uniref:protein piccolo-like n=1 Tax=Pezoporus flaviventris TaxID=889875 RepID=UPI002AAFFCD5|nr:protein piccolo-like [Pezoporus flaviventris]XP_061326912.1 protein piccolo-like [Pezoporus flaviventris]XP_061326913.1 protein piccolo-like [Pezoporus flaviventris]